MNRRLVLSYLAVAAVVLLLLELPLALFYSQRESGRFAADVERDASVIATMYEDGLETNATLDPRPAVEYHARTGARVVVVDADGTAWVDTGDTVPRDFSTRPEIATALSGRRASGTRHSGTLRADLLYVALPVASGGTVHGAVRLTLGTGRVDAQVHRFWLALGGIAAIVLGVTAAVGTVIARSVTRPLRRMQADAKRFASGDLTVAGAPVRAAAELGALEQAMSAMAVRLDSLLAEQRSFVADASHQLRTPLTALRLRLENLQATAQAAEADVLEAALAETERLSALVGDLLQLARADQPQPAVEIDLSAVVAQRVDTWSALAVARGVTLELAVGGTSRARAVPGAVEQILDNTLDNAIRASRPGGLVEVEIAVDGTMQRLSIADHGPGLDEAGKTNALRRFWRGSTTEPGTGLGLPIAAALAAASGGRLSLEDTPAGGLTVVVQLPSVS